MALTKKNTPKYMCLNADSQFELAKNIDDALLAAEQANQLDKSQLCFQVFYDQLIDRLHEEYGVNWSQILNYELVADKSTLLKAMLEMLQVCAGQFQMKMEGKKELKTFQLGFKSVLERSLVDALDIIMARDLWRFDLQRNLQDVQRQAFKAVDVYQIE